MMERIATGVAKPMTQAERVRELIESAPPRHLRLVKPRRPRGYWCKYGVGGMKVLEMAKGGASPADVARKLGERYGNIYAVGLRLGCWRESPRPTTLPMENSRNKEPQEIDWSNAPIFEMYGHADAYASVPMHVSKSGGMK